MATLILKVKNIIINEDKEVSDEEILNEDKEKEIEK